MKPRIYKHRQYQRWVSEDFCCRETIKFIDRLNRKDTGYKDRHGCTIRYNDILINIDSGCKTLVDDVFVEFYQESKLYNWAIVRP